jgi:tetratricopeptide (TPR) repeat protein
MILVRISQLIVCLHFVCFVGLYSNRIAAQKNVDYYSQKGVDCVYKNQFDSAVFYFSKVISLDPTNEIAYIDRGLAYEQNHQIQEAITDYTSQIGVDSFLADAYFLRGICCLKIGDTAAALNDCLQVVALDFHNSDAHYFAGQCYLSFHDLKNADSCFLHAIQVNPENTQIYSDWLLCKLAENDLKGAKKLIDVAPESTSLLLAKSLYWGKSKNYSEALISIQQAVQLGSFDSWSIYSKPTYHQTNKQFKRVLRTQIEKAGIDTAALCTLTQISFITGNLKIAEQLLNTLDKLEYQNIHTWRLKACNLRLLKQKNEALRMRKIIASSSSAQGFDLLLLSMAYLESGNLEEACKSYNSYLHNPEADCYYPMYQICTKKP